MLGPCGDFGLIFDAASDLVVAAPSLRGLLRGFGILQNDEPIWWLR